MPRSESQGGDLLLWSGLETARIVVSEAAPHVGLAAHQVTTSRHESYQLTALLPGRLLLTVPFWEVVFVIEIPPSGFGPSASRFVDEGERLRLMVRLPAPMVRDLTLAARSRGCSITRVLTDILDATDIGAYGFTPDGDAPA